MLRGVTDPADCALFGARCTPEDPVGRVHGQQRGRLRGALPLQGAGRCLSAADASGERVLLGHGSGGKLYRDLVKDVFVRAFANPVLERLDDAAALAPSRPHRLHDGRARGAAAHASPAATSAGSRVAGTVNDLATAAARPLALAAAFVIEEGFALDDLRAVCASMAATAREAGVPIVTGDTKVVERGAADGLFITTTGVGEIVVAHELGSAAVRDGDAVILSGSIGDHAVAILAARGEFDFRADVRSDCAPLWGLVDAAVTAARASGGEEAVRFLRDPTRGGLTTVLAELAEESGLGIEVEEEAHPRVAGGPLRVRPARLRPADARQRGQDGAGDGGGGGRRRGRRRPRDASTDATRGGSASSPPPTPAASPCARRSARAACWTCRSGSCCRGSAREGKLEPGRGFEPRTPSLPWRCSAS